MLAPDRQTVQGGFEGGDGVEEEDVINPEERVWVHETPPDWLNEPPLQDWDAAMTEAERAIRQLSRPALLREARWELSNHLQRASRKAHLLHKTRQSCQRKHTRESVSTP